MVNNLSTLTNLRIIPDYAHFFFVSLYPKTFCQNQTTDKVSMKLVQTGWFAAVFLALVAGAQTAAAQDGTLVFTPQWTAQAQFAGYYVAEAKGFYREAGVDVVIAHPSSTQPAMTRLRKNECQATTLQLCHIYILNLFHGHLQLFVHLL